MADSDQTDTTGGSLRAADPRVVGPFQLLSRIGSGGMGVVYLAEDPAGHRVALKLVRPELADDPAFRARFRREVEAGQRVGGICTAKYIDADLESEHPYLVTEYVEAGNLADYVASQGPLADEQLIGLAVGLAEAIVAMHASGVIHRDLKPSNVLMAPSGPKVVDFGISHAADGTALTQTGVIVGSPSWMSPEQAQGGETTPAVDVFAWGATIAFAATGQFPFGEGRPDAVIYRVVHEEPDLSGVDPKLLPFVSAALTKNPSARPAADKLLVDVVKTAMAGELPPGGSVAMTTLVLDRTWVKEPPTPTVPKTRRGRQIADRRVHCSDLGRRRCGDHCPRDAWVRNDEGNPRRSYGVEHEHDDRIFYDGSPDDAHGTADVEHPDLFDRPTQRRMAYLRPIHGQLFQFCGHLPVFLDGRHERADADHGSSRWARPARRKPDDGKHGHRDLSTSDHVVVGSAVSAVRPSGRTRRRSRLLDQLQVRLGPPGLQQFLLRWVATARLWRPGAPCIRWPGAPSSRSAG